MHQQQEPSFAQPGEVLLVGPGAAGYGVGDCSIEVRLCCRAGVGVCGHVSGDMQPVSVFHVWMGFTVFQGHARPTPWFPDMRGRPKIPIVYPRWLNEYEQQFGRTTAGGQTVLAVCSQLAGQRAVWLFARVTADTACEYWPHPGAVFPS